MQQLWHEQGFLLVWFRWLHAYTKCCYQVSFKKIRNKEVSAHIQLWDPSNTQSGLDAKDLWVLSATELLINLFNITMKQVITEISNIPQDFLFCLQIYFPHIHVVCNSIISNTFSFQRHCTTCCFHLFQDYLSDWSC